MSPHTTFQNWGSSSRLHFRRKRPTRVWRGSRSLLCVWRRSCVTGAASPAAVLAHGPELVDVELAVGASRRGADGRRPANPTTRGRPAPPSAVNGSRTTKMQKPTTRSKVGLTHAHVDPVRTFDDHVIRFGPSHRQPTLVPIASGSTRERMPAARHVRHIVSSTEGRRHLRHSRFFDGVIDPPEAANLASGHGHDFRGNGPCHAATATEWRSRASVRTSRSWRVVTRAS